MRDLNKVIVSGRAVKDAEYKEVEGLKIATFMLACNYDDKVNYLPVTCFNGLAENVAEPFISKGKALQIEGRLKQDRFENEEGVNVSRIKIIAEKIILQGGSVRTEEAS